MPKRNGYEVAAFVKQHPQFSHVPVLLLAGAFEPVDEARARQVRADGILVKPFEPQQVIERVRELVDASRYGDSRPATRDLESGSRGPDLASRGPGSDSRVRGPELLASDDEAAATSLDDYFERLDASFATPGPPWTLPPAPAAAADSDERST